MSFFKKFLIPVINLSEENSTAEKPHAADTFTAVKTNQQEQVENPAEQTETPVGAFLAAMVELPKNNSFSEKIVSENMHFPDNTETEEDNQTEQKAILPAPPQDMQENMPTGEADKETETPKENKETNEITEEKEATNENTETDETKEETNENTKTDETKEETIAADKEPEVRAETETLPAPMTIQAYFNSKGITINIPTNTATIAPVESLAYNIAISYPKTKAFIRFIRDCITKKKFEFVYSSASHSHEERNAITSLAELLNEYGLISNLYHNKANNTLRGMISTSPRCTNFINGDFLEMYARCVAVGVIKKAAEEYGCDYELYHNVLIHKGAENHEIDIVFRLGKQVFWSEIKSGKFNPDEYRKLGLFMDFVPDKLIMLAADKTTDAAEVISYFYEYYCANITTFRATLNNMIKKAMEVK